LQTAAAQKYYHMTRFFNRKLKPTVREAGRKKPLSTDV